MVYVAGKVAKPLMVEVAGKVAKPLMVEVAAAARLRAL
jgi:hypothetical protein